MDSPQPDGKIEIFPVGPGQQKIEHAAAVALHSLVERNERLTTALSEILMLCETGQYFAAHRAAKKALDDL